MKPISQERIGWLGQRQVVLEASIKFAQSQMYAVQGGGVERDELQRALIGFNTERVQNNIELKILSNLVVGP